jgi:hypothetical protein
VHQVLHWHIVDFQAFPFRSKAMPKLVKGAYSDAETYSAEDVNAIVRAKPRSFFLSPTFCTRNDNH